MPQTAASSDKIGWLAALNPRFLSTPSVLVLIVANLLPLYGVLFWGWDLYSLMVLYWMETGIIGFFAIIRMAMAAGIFAVIMVPFFIVHFGGFMAGHIFFLIALFGGVDRVGGPAGFLPLVWAAIVEHGLWLAFVALFISHCFSFVVNVMRPLRKEKRAGDRQAGMLGQASKRHDAHSHMMAPYGRVVLMHLTIIFGAFLIHLFDTKAAAFVLLIALKLVFDIASHVRKNYAAIRLTTH